MELNDYLPFGEKCVYPDLISGNNDYLYGGKECQTFIDMPQWYDSGARFLTTSGIFLSYRFILERVQGKYLAINGYEDFDLILKMQNQGL